MTGPGQTVGVSVFIDPMVEALDTSRAAVSSAYLVGTLTGATAMPVVGRFIDRRGIRWSQLIVGVAFTVALVAMAGVNSVLLLAAGFAGIRMFGQGALSMVSSVSVAVWFERRRGVAMGLLSTISGALTMLVPVVLNVAIEATSWRIAWLMAAAAVAVVVLPVGWFGLVEPPDEPPDPAVVTERPTALISGAGGPPPAGPPVSYTRGQAVRTRPFWILTATGVTSGMMSTALNFHQIDLLGEAGLSPGQAAAMFVPQVVGSATAALLVGYVLDRLGARLVPTATMVLLIVVHLLAADLSDGATVLVYAVALGAVGGAVRSALATMVPGYFGVAHIGSIQGLMFLAMVAGTALGPVTLSIVRLQAGSYRSANLILALIPAATLLFTLTNRRPEPVAGDNSYGPGVSVAGGGSSDSPPD